MHISRRTLLAGAVTGFALPNIAMADAWNPPEPDHEWHIAVRGGRIYVRANGDLVGRRAPVIITMAVPAPAMPIFWRPSGSHATVQSSSTISWTRVIRIIQAPPVIGRSSASPRASSRHIGRTTSA